MNNFSKQNLRTICIYVAVFSLVFIGGVVLFGAYWVKSAFGAVDFSQILFHLRFPLLDNNTPFVGKFLGQVLLPAFACASLITFPQIVLKVITLFYAWLKKATFGKVAFAFVLFALCLNVTNNKLKITRYLKTQETYSNLYENHYKPFDSANLADFKPKQNLIVILAESMESTFSAKNIPTTLINVGGGNSLDYSPFGELIPNLTNFALKNTNFSTTDALGGVNQLNGTGWTIAGTIGYLCGIPLNMPIHGNDFSNKHFLDSAICVSDILAQVGYKQAILAGTDFDFAGKRNFFQNHHIKVMDLPYFQAQNLIPNPLPQNMRGVWDLKDAELFKLAKNYLESLSNSQHFALYLLNVDTHFHDNFVDKEHCAGFEQSYLGTIQCTDKLMSDFVRFVQNSRFGANTTIIILGDHLSMNRKIFNAETKRFIYNAFINPQFTQKPTLKLTKNRELSHFDITPLILDSLGIRTESFGLGRNPLYGESLLESDFDINSLNALLVQRNKIYDSFWEVKNAR